MYSIVHHADNGPQQIGTDDNLTTAIGKARVFLDAQEQRVGEEKLVVTIWRYSAVAAVVLDDGNGLAAYSLKPIR